MPHFPSGAASAARAKLIIVTANRQANQIDQAKDDLHSLILGRTVEEPLTGCWLWQGKCHHRTGAAVAKFHGQHYSVARVALWVYRGEELRFDLFDSRQRVSCCWRKKNCVNPEHLELASIKSRQACA